MRVASGGVRVAGYAVLAVLVSACKVGGGSTPGQATASEGAVSGDVPDNAVYLTYDSPAGFRIQYVEGWQVTPSADGVTIRDKDSSESVQIVTRPTDLAAYVHSADLPSLQRLSGFALKGQDMVTFGNQQLTHLAYAVNAPPDPVTGKSVASNVDRYYVPGTASLAIVTLSTPTGVDNVDAFRQMIESFRWR